MFCPLLVSLDDPDALAAALQAGADALLLDLGDAGAPGDRTARRGAASMALSILRGFPPTIVRVAPLASGLLDADLDAVMAGGAPHAVLLPGAVGRADVQHLAAKLAVHEAGHGLPAGRTGIVAAPADTAVGVLALGTLPGASPRLAALAWDPAALAADLGFDAPAMRTARDLLLLAAAACRVPAFDLTPAGDRPAEDRIADRRDGFAGRLAFRPAEVAAFRGAEGLRS